MKVDLYNQKGEKVGDISLPKGIFSYSWNPDLVHQAFLAQLAGRREPIAHTKTRKEVRGGGRKPWRQKGTGRARHGSIRSPLWKGGGVTFGPSKDKKFEKKINKRMKRSALFSVLSRKLKDNEIKFIDTLDLEESKTGKVDIMLDNIFGDNRKSALFIPTSKNKKFNLAVRNVEDANSISPLNLNIYDCLAYRFLVFDKEAIEEIREHFVI